MVRNSPTVSIAMATYNGAAYLGEQLDSFAQQLRLPDELVVTDDGSIDGTIELVEAFAQRCPFPVRIHRNPKRLGYSSNFGRAVSLCTGDLISLSDQDDSWYPGKLVTVLDMFERDPSTQLVINDQDIAVDGIEPSGATTLGNVRRLGFGDAYFTSGCCMTIRRGFLDLLLPFPSPFPYDHWCGRIAGLLGVKRINEQPLQAFRRHGANTSNDISVEVSPSTLSMVRRYRLRDPRAGWRLQLALLRTYARRLAERRELAAGLSSPQRVDEAVRTLHAEVRWLEKRLDLLALPRTRRAARVMALWGRGYYDERLGWKSAVKDLIRR